MTASSPTPSRPQRADARRNIERLVAAAREAFVAQGPSASLDDIARRAGVGPGTLYRHFPTRAALIEAVYRDVIDQICLEGEALLQTDPPGEAFAAWLRYFVDHVGEKHGLAAAMSNESGPDSAVFAESRARVSTTGGALLARAKAAGAINPDARLDDVFRLVSAIAQAGEQSPEGTDLSDRLLRLALDGLRAGAPGG